MDVEITYRGIDGKTTSLTASSPSDAMDQLCGIRGYNGNLVDAAMVDLAKAIGRSHGKAV